MASASGCCSGGSSRRPLPCSHDTGKEASWHLCAAQACGTQGAARMRAARNCATRLMPALRTGSLALLCLCNYIYNTGRESCFWPFLSNCAFKMQRKLLLTVQLFLQCCICSVAICPGVGLMAIDCNWGLVIAHIVVQGAFLSGDSANKRPLSGSLLSTGSVRQYTHWQFGQKSNDIWLFNHLHSSVDCNTVLSVLFAS